MSYWTSLYQRQLKQAGKTPDVPLTGFTPSRLPNNMSLPYICSDHTLKFGFHEQIRIYWQPGFWKRRRRWKQKSFRDLQLLQFWPEHTRPFSTRSHVNTAVPPQTRGPILNLKGSCWTPVQPPVTSNFSCWHIYQQDKICNLQITVCTAGRKGPDDN